MTVSDDSGTALHDDEVTGSRRIIITGGVQSGKSTLCRKLADRLLRDGVSLAGFIALGLWRENQRWGFDLRDLSTGKITPLARRRYSDPIPGKPTSDKKTQRPHSILTEGSSPAILKKRMPFEQHQIPFDFMEPGIRAGRRALSPKRCARADLIIIDEIGPLELQGGGWANQLPPLMKETDVLQLWVVRKQMVKPVQDRWPFDRNDRIHADGEDALGTLTGLCHQLLNL